MVSRAECFAQDKREHLFKMFFDENKFCAVDIEQKERRVFIFISNSDDRIKKYRIIPEELINKLFVNMENK